ncbi:MAG: hypothetical protein JO050_00430 [Acidimicrobiia bacterium]|nr:hypothetical protein [Acidimicrobiia bacterium]
MSRRLGAGADRLWGDTTRRGRLWDDTKVALPGWITARALVLGVVVFAHFLYDHLHIPVGRKTLHQGLLAWDGQWYQRIARHGYGPISRTALRFFPLYPLLGRALGIVLGGLYGVALIILANVPALLFAVLLVRLVRREGGDARTAERAAWFVALVPPAFVLVFAYSEAVAGCLAVAMFLALRSKRWWWAVAWGFLSGLTRPSGALLAVPAAIEGLRGARGLAASEIIGRLAAVVAPLAGVGAYLGWVGLRFGHPMLPLDIQNRPWLRAGFLDPATAVKNSATAAFAGHFGGNGIHFPFVLLFLALVVVVCLRWPLPYGAYAAVTLLVALSAHRLGSVERYCLLTFPFVLAIVSLTRSRRVELGVLVASGACMAGFATLALLGAYVP